MISEYSSISGKNKTFSWPEQSLPSGKDFLQPWAFREDSYIGISAHRLFFFTS
jgi:hypothetical protein